MLRPGGTLSWWMRMVSEPDACHEFLDKAVDAALSQLHQIHDAVGSACDTLLIADDIGDGRGVTIGPDLWREIYKPHYKRLFSEWHRITDMKISLHSCGAISDIIDDLVECGVDVLNPLQLSADNMASESLKNRFGDKVIFYGGVYDAIQNPSSAKYEEVYQRVRKNIETLSRGGGYIFAGVHNLPGDLPEEHLRATLDAYNDCKWLPECNRSDATL